MATTAVSIEEYLKTMPDPDVEYVDGELKERPMVFSMHGRLQAQICIWFGNHRKAWKVFAAVEVRTQVSRTRVRLPDVVVDHAREWPEVLTKAPMVVIEILSPGDSFMELEQKCAEYSDMGVPNIWMINPQRRKGRLWQGCSWIETTRFVVEETDIYLDIEWLFAQMNSYEDSPDPV